MTDHPINTTIIDSSDVAKSGVRSYIKDRHRLRASSVSEVRSSDYSDAFGIDLGGQIYDKDTSDTTTADDGVTCIVDLAGTRFKSRLTGVGRRGSVVAVDLSDSDPATSGYTNGASIDGVTLATGDAVLRASASHKSRNGVWIVAASGGASRSSSFDTIDELAGAVVAAGGGGTTYKNTAWFCSANVTDTIGVSDIPFTQINFIASGGDVAGPSSAVNLRVVVFDGTTGKAIADGGVLLSELATLLSPGFTGTPTAPTAASGTDTTQIATCAFVLQMINTLNPPKLAFNRIANSQLLGAL